MCCNVNGCHQCPFCYMLGLVMDIMDISLVSWWCTGICNIKKMAQLAPQGFLATIRGGQGICLLNCSVFVTSKVNTIFVPLTLNIKWIRLVCMWRLFSLWCWWVCLIFFSDHSGRRLVSWVVHFCPEITLKPFLFVSTTLGSMLKHLINAEHLW